MANSNYPPRSLQRRQNCYYCLPENDTEWTCRRRAPEVPPIDPDALTTWPLVQAESWCGEWTPRHDVVD